jgi:2-polyprenyl-3-methyl-5-hydroxy-6-metoxy-1,4-benzoquinol methylase
MAIQQNENSMPDSYRASDRRDMLPLIPPRRNRILEIGCGEGRFLASIPGVDECWGVEPDPRAAALATQRLSQVVQATFETAKEVLPRHYFDVIVCNDVIEHMVDHDLFLESVKSYLSPGGSLIMSIPNVRHYSNLFELVVARDWEYRDVGILDRTHLRFFTERSLRRACLDHGYRIDEFKRINGGIKWGLSVWGVSIWLFAYALIVLSLGKGRDIAFMQFAVRASLID